jgi:sugar/nucleoside kinase (ribokinase family)
VSKKNDISIAGEINLDLILYGLPEDMPLERELLGTGFQVTLGSSSAILAHNLAVLGAQVGFVTLVGKDPLGKTALDRLQEAAVDLSRVRTGQGETSTGVTLILPHGKERHILTYLGTMGELAFEDLDLDYLKASRHFHLSSLFLLKALEPSVPRLFRELKQAGLTISLDTNDDPSGEWGGVFPEALQYVDVLFANQREACGIARQNSLEAAVDTLAQRVPWIAVKCGAEGSIVAAGGRQHRVGPVAVTPFDTIGAGDSFNAGFLFGYLQGWPPEQCARAGNVTGALSTLRAGGTEAFRDRDLVRQFLQENDFPGYNLARHGAAQ